MPYILERSYAFLRGRSSPEGAVPPRFRSSLQVVTRESERERECGGGEYAYRGIE